MFRTKTEILRALDPTRPDTIQALIDFHRKTFGGYTMGPDGDPGAGSGANTDGKPGDQAGQSSNANDGKPDTNDGKAGGKDGNDKDGAEALGAGGMKALQAEREARQKLETELKDFKAGQAEQAKKLAEALGMKPEGAKPEDVIPQLQKQIQDMQHDNLVFRIVTDPKHPISDKDDVELIKAAKDEETMRKLAARLAKKAEADPDADKKARRFPRQDPDQGRGGGNGNEGRPTSVAEVRREREAARAARDKARNA